MSSFLVDSNVLIYASDASSPLHKPARKAVESAFRSRDTWCIAWQNVYEFLCVVTHPSTPHPMAFEVASENVRAIFALSHVRIISETRDHWDVLTETVEGVKARGVFLHDCHLAAVMRENGVRRIITADEGFHRFHFLEVENPLKP